MRWHILASAILVIATCAAVLPAAADPVGPKFGVPKGQISEPWLAPRYHSPRGTPEHIVKPRPLHVPHRRASVPPPVISRDTGIAVPTLRTPSPAGPHGTETFQDRATRCTAQAGAYGAMAGNRTTYLGNCLAQ